MPQPRHLLADGDERKATGEPVSGPTILDHIGRTPLVRLKTVGREVPVPVFVKCEHISSGGSNEVPPTRAAAAEATASSTSRLRRVNIGAESVASGRITQ